MAKLNPNSNVITMIAFAIGFTYFGAFALADWWGMTTEELTRRYPVQFYTIMTIIAVLFLQPEVREQREAQEEKERQEKAAKGKDSSEDPQS